jgi:hypothetical protein
MLARFLEDHHISCAGALKYSKRFEAEAKLAELKAGFGTKVVKNKGKKPGLKVAKVEVGKALHAAGIKKGDIVLGVNGEKMTNVAKFTALQKILPVRAAITTFSRPCCAVFTAVSLSVQRVRRDRCCVVFAQVGQPGIVFTVRRKREAMQIHVRMGATSMKMAQLLELLDVSDSPLFWDLPLMSDDEAREILAQALTQLGAMDAMAPSESPAEELAAQLVQFVVEKGDHDAERKKSVSVGEAIDLAEKIYAGEVVLPRMVVFGSLVSLGLIDASPSDSVWQVSSH